MQNLWLPILILYFAKSQLVIDLLYNSSNDLALVSSIEASLQESFEDQIQILVRKKQIIPYPNNFEEKSDIIINLIGHSFAGINNLESDQIVLQAKKSKNLKNCFSWHSSISDHIKAFESLISYLNWEKFVVISDEDQAEYIGKILKQNYHTKSYYFPKNGSQALSNLLIGKQIKPTGIKNIVILNDGEDGVKLIQSLKAKNLYSGVLLLNQNLKNQINNGLAAYTESGLENANYKNDQECLAIIKFLRVILSYRNIYIRIKLNI
ncbi:unnamed protein product [Blepharisma stoltei]|uniref:Receptor ligand binding region domain-containing protein n=1 Tax=Blepharisma stoltei TaxID=1481888 RepID=A0AAU9I435_9CILI|nr:unnamed protein product [Blepharisma stoltei]